MATRCSAFPRRACRNSPGILRRWSPPSARRCSPRSASSISSSTRSKDSRSSTSTRAMRITWRSPTSWRARRRREAGGWRGRCGRCGRGLDMSGSLLKDMPSLLSADDFEKSLDTVRTAAAGPIEGIFGPESLTWRVDREAAIFLGAGRALLLQLAHPWVAAAISEHSKTFADPVGRFHRTFNITFPMVFGTLGQALAASRRLHRRHAAVTGILPQGAGRYEAGSRYSANEVAALRWVHATLVETALQTHDLVLPALTSSEREQYWTEAKLYAALSGIRPADLPADWASFAAYTEAMSQSDSLAVSPAARDIAEQIFSGRVTGLRIPRWYRALT